MLHECFSLCKGDWFWAIVRHNMILTDQKKRRHLSFCFTLCRAFSCKLVNVIISRGFTVVYCHVLHWYYNNILDISLTMPKIYGHPNITLTFWTQAAGICCYSTTTASWGPTPMVGEKIWPFPVYLEGVPPKICHSLKGATWNCFQIILGMWLDKQSTYHCLSRGSFNQWEQQQEPAVKTTKVSREKSENIFPIKKKGFIAAIVVFKQSLLLLVLTPEPRPQPLANPHSYSSTPNWKKMPLWTWLCMWEHTVLLKHERHQKETVYIKLEVKCGLKYDRLFEYLK